MGTFRLFGAPQSYFSKNDTVLLVNSKWLATPGLWTHFVTHSILSDNEIQDAITQHRIPEGFELVTITSISLPSSHIQEKSELKSMTNSTTIEIRESEKTFSENLYTASKKLFEDQWRKAYKEYISSTKFTHNKTEFQVNSSETLFKESPLLLLTSLYDAPLKTNLSQLSFSGQFPLLALIESNNKLFVLTPYYRYTLFQGLSLSLFCNSDVKLLFILYQIAGYFSKKSPFPLSLHKLSLHSIYIDSNYLISFSPRIFLDALDSFVKDSKNVTKRHRRRRSLKSIKTTELEHDSIEHGNLLIESLKNWTTGQMSNYDYLMLLNYLSGRTFENPNYYPILPWVRDFSSINGGWRDLTKSKFRLNKGDVQLELTYSNSQSIKEAHHISDVLSEITYYVYKARITSRETLTRIVRSKWVPAEYPPSLARLMNWTPDECIPDFYNNPSIFHSIHQDMPDLALPDWWSHSSEEFIHWHRSCLESDYVSKRLHTWIDLTFGYKLSGSPSIKAKNVCLHLVDNHEQLRDFGVLQLFFSPHPNKITSEPYFLENPPNLDMFLSFAHHEENLSKEIDLPKDYDPLSLLKTIEALESYTKNSTLCSRLNHSHRNCHCHIDYINRNCDHCDQRNCNHCDHGNRDHCDQRNCNHCNQQNRDHCNQQNRDHCDGEFKSFDSDDLRILAVLALELFLPKKFRALGRNASFSSRLLVALSIPSHEIPSVIRTWALDLLRTKNQFSYIFNSHFDILHSTLSVVKKLNESYIDVLRLPPKDFNFSAAKSFVGDYKVKFVAGSILPLLDSLTSEELSILLPMIQELFSDSDTRILSAWILFEPLSGVLGPTLSSNLFLNSLLLLYEAPLSSKHYKFYHRNFLVTLLHRLGTPIFLTHFVHLILGALGENPSNFPGKKEGKNDETLRQVANESIIWLSHRLGPILTAKYIARPLLDNLNGAYSGLNVYTSSPFEDSSIRISEFKGSGDERASFILEVLVSLIDLYGETYALHLYISHSMESLGKKNESGILGALSLLQSLIPSLSDTRLMKELQIHLLPHVLFPTFEYISSTETSDGFLLTLKLLDVIYLIGLRIGKEMCIQMYSPIAKVLTSFLFKKDEEFEDKNKSQSSSYYLLHRTYMTFSYLLSTSYLNTLIENELQLSEKLPIDNLSPLSILTFENFQRDGDKLSQKIGGNKIGTQSDIQSASTYLRKDSNFSKRRHLKGNWKIHWKSENVRSTTMNPTSDDLTLKELPLQFLTGHSSAIKSLHVLGNENSVMSGSKDKTVKLWSLRNDENEIIHPQWTYTSHKKSVIFVSFLNSLNLAASSDSTLHIWDPFVGSSLRLFPHYNLNALTYSSSLLIGSSDSSLYVFDPRSTSVLDLKVNTTTPGLVKALCLLSDDYSLCLAHSSGFLSCLDIRVGKLRHYWKGHEGDILTLTPLTSQTFISTALDATMSLWNYSDGKLVNSLSESINEPILSVALTENNREIIGGSTNNRICVKKGILPESSVISSKLRSNVLKGNLTTLQYLHLNHLLLLGQDNGSITLMC